VSAFDKAVPVLLAKLAKVVIKCLPACILWSSPIKTETVYQIENEYGRTIEVYQDNITIDGQDLTLDFLRIGRVALLYQTLDGQQIGAWDQAQRTWVALPDSYRDSIRQGVRIANKQLAPDLIRLPVPAPKESTR